MKIYQNSKRHMTPSRSSNRRALIAQIRFQLDQLTPQNGHHEFEHLCRQFARERITPLVLPATGPVSAGGDQGRDFETFTSFIHGQRKSDSSFFLGQGESQPLVFACSLVKRARVRKKIESDVEEICRAAKPYIIYFFSSQSIPVSLRHEAQAWSLETHKCRLEVLDAEALSEQLAQPELFWIATEYLHVPAELLPQDNIESSSEYNSAKCRWIVNQQWPQNFADFVEIKTCIRAATFNKKRRPDLPAWIKVMEKFLSENHHLEIKRRATYEICVAALRGLHNLTAKSSLVEDYFERWSNGRGLNELRDATVLLVYASTAILLGEFEFDRERLHQWSKRLVALIESEMTKAPGPNSLAELLYTRSTASQLVFLNSTEPSHDHTEIFKWWFKTLAAAAKAPLFPIEQFSDTLSKLAPYVGDDSRFRQIIDKSDELLAQRSSGYVVAEKCRDRAIAFMEAGKLLAAVRELQKAKVRWFTGDSIRASLLTTLLLSDLYLKLGLVWAAKYHALGAAYLIFKSNNEKLNDLFVPALHFLAECHYVGGEWLAFADLMPVILIGHYQHERDPDDWEAHEKLQKTLLHFFVARALGKALHGPQASILMDTPLASTEMPSDMQQELMDPPLPLAPYEQMSAVEVQEKTAAELWGRPFSDTGQERVYEWRALGINWTAKCHNTNENLPHAEQFVAILQIVLAGLAETELCLLPTTVEMHLAVENRLDLLVEDIPTNDQISVSIRLPKGSGQNLKAIDEIHSDVFGVATALLIQCSCLPDEKVLRALQIPFKDGLSANTFLVRPYSELFSEFSSSEGFEERRQIALGQVAANHFLLRDAPELRWMDGPGPGYSKAKAQAIIKNRYAQAIPPIRHTLERLKTSARFQQWVADLRKSGKQDWWILLLLANAVMNYRLQDSRESENVAQLKAEMMRIMNSEEEANAVAFPEELLYSDEFSIHEKMIIATTASTWGLVVRRKTPTLEALKQVMNMRYGQAYDDVSHDDPFTS